MVGIGFEPAFLVCTQPVDGRHEELVGGIRLYGSGRKEISVRYAVFAGGLYVYILFGFIYIHRIGDSMQQVTPSYRLGGFQFIVYERIPAFAQRYDVAAERFQSCIVPTVFRRIFQVTLLAAQQP